MTDFTEETNMEDFQLPETLTVKVQEEETVKGQKQKDMNYIHRSSRFIGLRFWYGEYQYLYKYPDDFEGKEGEKIILFDKSTFKNFYGENPSLSENEFRIVEVIKVDKGYVLCTLLQ